MGAGISKEKLKAPCARYRLSSVPYTSRSEEGDEYLVSAPKRARDRCERVGGPGNGTPEQPGDWCSLAGVPPIEGDERWSS